MTHEEPPRPRFVPPDVREAARDRSAGHETRARRVADRLHGLQPHDDDEGAVGADELDLPLEARKVDDTRPYERLEDRPSSDHHLVVRRIDDELLGPEPLERGDIALQRGNPFLVVERAHVILVRAAILCHGHRPQ